MLHQKVKINTKNIHKYVEKSPIMKSIMSGSITPKAYLNYLVQIDHIYQVLEKHPLFDQLDWKIKLSSSSDDDLYSLVEMYDLNLPALSEITTIYGNYLKKINNLDSLAAHCYVRYMADLSGGQIIKGKLPSDWEKSLYDLGSFQNREKKKKMIWDYIDQKVTNPDLFEAEVHHSFMAYASILS